MYLKEIGEEIVQWITMVQDRDQWRNLVNKVLNSIQLDAKNFSTSRKVV